MERKAKLLSGLLTFEPFLFSLFSFHAGIGKSIVQAFGWVVGFDPLISYTYNIYFF